MPLFKCILNLRASFLTSILMRPLRAFHRYFSAFLEGIFFSFLSSHRTIALFCHIFSDSLVKSFPRSWFLSPYKAWEWHCFLFHFLIWLLWLFWLRRRRCLCCAGKSLCTSLICKRLFYGSFGFLTLCAARPSVELFRWRAILFHFSAVIFFTPFLSSYFCYYGLVRSRDYIFGKKYRLIFILNFPWVGLVLKCQYLRLSTAPKLVWSCVAHRAEKKLFLSWL